MSYPTQERLKELLYYSIISGKFYWGKPTSGRVKCGDLAGSVNNVHGYRAISIDGKSYRANRLVFLYLCGYLPIEADHINHIRDANMWINLRPTTRLGNSRNMKLKKNNTSGYNGVIWDKNLNKWRAVIQIEGKTIYLGSFQEKSEAILSRKAADIKYGFHKNHGNKN